MKPAKFERVVRKVAIPMNRTKTTLLALALFFSTASNLRSQEPVSGLQTFAGIRTFVGAPYIPRCEKLEADIAVLGVPFDEGTWGWPGERYGPRDIREGSQDYKQADLKNGFYYFDSDTYVLKGKRWADCGDVEVAPTVPALTNDHVTEAVKRIRDQKAFPVVIGGDHSITFPIIRALQDVPSIMIVHFDAHLDLMTLVATFHSGAGIGFHQVLELNGGVVAYRNLKRDSDGAKLAPTGGNIDPLFALGYGFGYGLSDRTNLDIISDYSFALHERKNLSNGTSNTNSMPALRVSLRMGFGGTARLQVAEQAADGLVGGAGVVEVPLVKAGVLVPAIATGGRTQDLDETDATFHQAPRHQAALRKGFGYALVQAV